MDSIRSFSRLLSAACFTLMLGGTALAQSAPSTGGTSTTAPGLLGQSYAFFDVNYVDQRHGAGETYGPTVGANFAVADFIDLAASYTYSKQHNWPNSGSSHNIGFDMTVYVPVWRVKVFGVGGMGYHWTSVQRSPNISLWDIGGGVEIPVMPQMAVMAKAVLVGSVNKGVSQAWQYSAEANYWLRQNIAIAGGVTFVEDKAIGYSVGARYKF